MIADWHLQRPSPWAVDALIAGALTLLVVVQVSGSSQPSLFPVALLMTVPLLWRRRAPLAVGAAVILGMLLVGSLAPLVALAATLIASLSMALHSSRRLVVLGILLATACAIDVRYRGGVPNFSGYLFPFALLFPAWTAGIVLRGQRMRADGFRSRADQLEREQELTTRAALAEERSRIARELHDVVAHHVSVMVVQAGAARQVLESSPASATDALLAVEQTGREAMAEMRNLLSVLGDGDSAAVAPQPRLTSLPTLVEKVRDAGLPVSLEIIGTPRALPPGIDLTAFRIVQEALTNALKYSNRAATAVGVDYQRDQLVIEVVDEGEGVADSSTRASGRGLLGMQERVGIFGGRLEAGPRLERGYAVRAWLPLGGEPQ